MSPNESIPEPGQFLPISALDAVQSLPIGYEVFCAELVLGSPATQAAVSAGFADSYAEWLVKRPEIIKRVGELVLERQRDGGITSKLWAELQLVRIARDAIEGVPDKLRPDGTLAKGMEPNHDRAITAVNSICKLKGYIVDRKQTLSGRIDLGSASGQALPGMLDDALGELSPEQASRIRELTAPRVPRTKRVPRTVDATPGK